MDKIGRILLIGLAAGFLLSIWGTLARLVLTPFVVGSTSALKAQSFQTVLLSFFLDVFLGFLYVAAYSIFFGRNGTPFLKRFSAFWAMLALVGVLPRVVSVYKYFALMDKLVLAWGVAWLLEASLVAVLVCVLYPLAKRGAKPELPS